MKTLKITVDDTPQAELLIDMLRGLAFVRKVEDESSLSLAIPSLDAIRRNAIHR